MDVPDACKSLLPKNYQVPHTEEIEKARRAILLSKGVWAEITVATRWQGKKNRVAWAYNFQCYARVNDVVQKISEKDWDDDGETYRIGNLALSRFEGLRNCLARAIPIASSIGVKHLRVYTENTWTSAVCKPQKGYALNLPREYKETAYHSRRILESFAGYPDSLFSRGLRVDERLTRGIEARRFGHLQRRLRWRLDPDGVEDKVFWVDMQRVKSLLDQIEGRKPNFSTALMYHLRDERELPVRVIRENIGVDVGTINRSANRFKDLLGAQQQE